jgi:hypothetical protein
MPDRPDFLIIGAMKAGTTSLYRDLHGHPQVFVPEEKEPECLLKAKGSVETARKDFSSLFRGAPAGKLCGEASTGYTKRPLSEGVAQLALDLCGPELKLIFLERDPVKRAISHFRHEVLAGRVPEDADAEQEILTNPIYAQISAYAYQIAPWCAAFPDDNILRLSFESYIADKAGTLEKVYQFLGVECPDSAIGTQEVHNSSSDRPTPPGFLKWLIATRLYQRGVKRLVPWGLRNLVAQRLLPKATAPKVELSENVRSRFLDKVAGMNQSSL